jgi:hypothetical protein
MGISKEMKYENEFPSLNKGIHNNADDKGWTEVVKKKKEKKEKSIKTPAATTTKQTTKNGGRGEKVNNPYQRQHETNTFSALQKDQALQKEKIKNLTKTDSHTKEQNKTNSAPISTYLQASKNIMRKQNDYSICK